MKRIEVSTHVHAPVDEVFRSVSDIPHSADRIRAIKKVEVLGPSEVKVGFRWRETREMMGKEAVEEMWITQLSPPHFYTVEANNHGMKYLSGVSCAPDGDGTVVTMFLEAEPETFVARCLSRVMAPLMSGSVKKAFAQDLEDIKRNLES